VFIARTNSEYCAVAILDSYLKAADIDLKSDMIIFRSVTYFKTSNTFLLRKQNSKEHKGNKRKSVSDLGKLKLLNIGLITSASTGVFIRIGLFNNLLEASTMLRSQLKTLLLQLRSTILSSKAKSTVSKYANGFNRFWLWAKKYSEISSVLPASELHASLYLQFLIDSCKHYSSVESAFSNVLLL
jgi:hypothetical protein